LEYFCGGVLRSIYWSIFVVWSYRISYNVTMRYSKKQVYLNMFLLQNTGINDIIVTGRGCIF
jgi:hypothetical protein